MTAYQFKEQEQERLDALAWAHENITGQVHLGYGLFVRTNGAGHVGWCNDWPTFVGLVASGVLGQVRKVSGGPATFGHVDYYL